MAGATASRKTIRLQSELSSVGLIEQAAEDYARLAGFDDDTAGQIGMVAREATVNAMLHGNAGDATKHVTATLEQDDAMLRITIADEGSGFDPDGVPDPLAPENLMRSSGRGIFLMRAYMDEVHFRQLHPGQATILIKHRVQNQT